MERTVIVALVVGLVIGLAAMYAAAPALPGTTRTSTTTVFSTVFRLVPTTVVSYKTSVVTETVTATTVVTTTTTLEKRTTVTRTLTTTLTETTTRTVTTTTTVTTTHIPEVSFVLNYKSVSEGWNGTWITTGSYGITTANGTWILFFSSETMDEQGNIVDSYHSSIEARLSEDGKILVLTWEPSMPVTESIIVKVYLYSEDGELLAKGSEIVTPGTTEVSIVLQWIEKGLPTRLVVEMAPVK